MLVLHCGLPRTSTTSLQAALSENRERLAGAGIVYPDQWGKGKKDAHHGIGRLLNAAPESGDSLDDFKRSLAAPGDRHVLISAENLTRFLLSRDKVEALLSFVAAIREVTPVRCIWTLRRLDEVLSSAYLLMLRLGSVSLPDPREYSIDSISPDALFESMRRLEEGVAGDSVYVKYDPRGLHNGELLRAAGVPERLAAEIQAGLDLSRRRNASATHKQAVALANLDSLSDRAEARLDGVAVRHLFKREGFEFEQDWPCQLLDRETRRDVHERALTASRKQGWGPYAEFFADDEIVACSPEGLDPKLITDADLDRLVSRLEIRAL